jgi:hypothetical protein
MSEDGWKIKILARASIKAAFWICREPLSGITDDLPAGREEVIPMFRGLPFQGSPKAIRGFTSSINPLLHQPTSL